jgi:arginyl-tRNA synthetase
LQFDRAISEAVATILRGKGLDPGQPPLIESPKDPRHGDLAYPCFHLARQLKRSPQALAQELALELAGNPPAGLEPPTAIGPYLNFHISPAFLAQALLPTILDGSLQAPRPPIGCRTMVEFSQPNTHKAFHVGHMRNVALGDALVRLLRWQGHEVIAANYIGDVGTHIAKCLWYFRNHFKGRLPQTHRGEFLGKLYASATEMLDFHTLTHCPHPGVEAAKVNGIRALPEQRALVSLETSQGTIQVVCAAKGYALGDLVAWAKPGARLQGRLVQQSNRAGWDSFGMLCSARELEMGEDGENLLKLPADMPIGCSLAEWFRLPSALPAGQSVLAEMEKRSRGVQETLQALEAEEGEIHRLWLETRQWSLAEFQDIYQWVDCHFDHVFYESEVAEEGKAMVAEFLERGVLVRSEGAVGADLEPFGLPFLLLLKSDGTGLYATKDLALARRKFENFAIDQSLYVVDASQSLHFQQVFKTLALMGFTQAERCRHLAYGLVVLPEGKMSSRQGNIILFSTLREQLCSRISSEFLEKYRGQWPDEEIEQTARALAIATIRYGMLNQDATKNIVFDMADWTSRSGNTGPYLMYAYARTRSVLREMATGDIAAADWSLLTHPVEKALLLVLAEFPTTVDRSACEGKPHILCTYLYSLAKEFARFWDQCPVLKAPSPQLAHARAGLVAAVGELLGKGLQLLGIPLRDRM